VKTINAVPLSDSELARIDAYWRAANYLTVGQIYLVGNVLLERAVEVPDVKLEVRVGDAARTVGEVARELDVDLVALAWHRDLADGHGRLVRTLLVEADVPVLLLPITAREKR
jgi:hypothetical protein